MWSVKRKAARGDGELWWECCDAFWKLQWELSAFVIVLMHFQDWEGSGFFFFCASVHMNSCKWRSINFAWASIKPTLFDPVDCAACAWLYFCVRVCALDLNFGPRALHYVPPRIVRHPTLHRRLCSPARRLHNAIAMHGDTFTVCDTGSKTQSWQRWGRVSRLHKNKDFSFPTSALSLGQGFLNSERTHCMKRSPLCKMSQLV